MKKNVLLVEDDPALRMVMREVLKDEFTIDEADNGVDGIEKGLNAPNDLIILDYHLPKKDGLQVIAAVKKAHPNVPVIVLTGYLNPESEAKFSRLGADKIFPKPFNYRSLLDTVRALMASRDAALEAIASLEAESQSATHGKSAKPVVHIPITGPQLSPTEGEMLVDSLNTLAGLAEKVEFLQSVTEKYWIEPGDISAVRETARAMEAQIQRFYGKMNNSLFDNGTFTSPLLGKVTRPSLSGTN